MDSERLHDALTRAGLTDYQADAYLSLLEMGTAPVVDVAERSGVPASQAYDVVRRLEDRGFVETVERDRLHARAVEPDDVLDELRDLGDLLTDAAEEVEDRWEAPDPDSHRVSVVKRQETVLSRAETAIEEATVAVELAATVEQVSSLRSALEAAADRGVVVRVAVYPPHEGLDLSGSAITEVRASRLPGPFIAIVDRRQSFFSPNVHVDDPYGILLDEPQLSFTIHRYFLTCSWAPYEPIYRASPEEKVYVGLEEFIHEHARDWYDGATVELTVLGYDVGTGESVELSGTLEYVLTRDNTPPEREPSYGDMGLLLTLLVDDGTELVTVGGWGAVIEDVAAEVIRVDAIEPPTDPDDRRDLT